MQRKEYTEKDVLYIQQLMRMNDILSLDAPVTGSDGEVGGTLQDFVQDTENDLVEQAIDKNRIEVIDKILNECLSPREIRVIQERFGLLDGIPKSLEEIGHTFGVTRERVRQIERQVLVKLRKYMRRNNINSINNCFNLFVDVS